MNTCIENGTLLHSSPRAESIGARLSKSILQILTTSDLWYERRQQRRQLGMMDDHMLRDIGLDRATARDEASKPFWRD